MGANFYLFLATANVAAATILGKKGYKKAQKKAVEDPISRLKRLKFNLNGIVVIKSLMPAKKKCYPKRWIKWI